MAAVRWDSLSYYLESCGSPSMGLIGLNSLLSYGDVNCKIDFSSVPDSLESVTDLCRVGCRQVEPAWAAGSWVQRPWGPGEAGLSLLCRHLRLSGMPVSALLCRFMGTARQQLPPIIFSLKLSPLCSSLTALLPNLPICSIDKGSLSQLWFCFSVSRWQLDFFFLLNKQVSILTSSLEVPLPLCKTMAWRQTAWCAGSVLGKPISELCCVDPAALQI